MNEMTADDTQNSPKPARPRVDSDGVRDFLSGFLKGATGGQAELADIDTVKVKEPAAYEVLPDETAGALRSAVIDALSAIYDPEIPVNIYELGLIYSVEIDSELCAHVTMTLTTPHCPVAESMPGEVSSRVLDVDGVRDVDVKLVWEPKWETSMMSEAARLELGLL